VVCLDGIFITNLHALIVIGWWGKTRCHIIYIPPCQKEPYLSKNITFETRRKPDSCFRVQIDKLSSYRNRLQNADSLIFGEGVCNF